MYAKILAATLALTVTACATPAENEAEVVAAEAAGAIPADQQAFLDTCKAWDEWDKPAPPFKVFGNTFHVGTCGISAILITGDKGHVLIDTGTQNGAEVVADNIKQLGFKLSDVEIMLHSHEHFDHVGGFAWMQEQTGAEIMASLPAKQVLKSGIVAANDPQHDTHEPMAPVKVGGPVWGGTEINLGDISIRAIETPGHSPGALSWAWQECTYRCENIIYADSLSPVSRDDYKFSAHPKYLAEYRAGLARIAQQGCEILLTPHPSHSRMLKRMQAGELIQNAPGDTPCKDYAAGKLMDIEQRLIKELKSP